MDILKVFPPDVTLWLTRYGLFMALVFFIVLLFLVLMRPFFLWWSGLGEVKEKASASLEIDKKILLELELLNKTLSIPVKRAQKKAREGEPRQEQPLVLSQDKKEEFLKALERSRERLKDGAGEGE